MIKKTTLAVLLLAGSTLSPLPIYAQDAAGSQKIIPPSTQSQEKGGQDDASTKSAATINNSAQMQQQSGTADTKADAQLRSQPGSADAGAKAGTQIKPQDNRSVGAAAAGADKNHSADQAQPEQMKKDANTAAQADQKSKSNNDTAATQNSTDQGSAQSIRQGGAQDRQSAQGVQSGTTDANRSSTAQSNTTNQTNISNTNSASADRPSNEVTGSINISAEQKTEIRNVIVESKVETVKPTFSVSVGVSVPKTVKLHRLPPKVVEIVPQYKNYEYFVLADNRIVIVEPSTYEIVYILVV